MRTTLAIKEEILEEVKGLSGAKTKKEAVEKTLEEYMPLSHFLRFPWMIPLSKGPQDGDFY